MTAVLAGLAACMAFAACAQPPEFQKISLRYKDGHTEVFKFGLKPYVIIAADAVTVVFLKDKQVVARNALRLICRDDCPDNLKPALQDTIVWDGRKPLETRGKVFSDIGFAFLQDGRMPVKNAAFDRVLYIQFAE